jgi:signal transduction histidine kinase
MIRSTQGQVAALVAASVFAAFLLHFIFVLFTMRSMGEPEHFHDRTALQIVTALYRDNPALRPALLRQSAAEGMVLREIPDSVVRDCTAPPPKPACAILLPLFMPRLRATDSVWLGIDSRPPRPPGRGPRGQLAALIALVGLPTLALSLWASRGVTAPLRRLTDQAERVDPETTVAPLRVEGTTEIRLLAEAFNRLILRLTQYAAEQRRTLAAISHDLRTPLTRLRLRADLVAEPAMREKLLRDVGAMQTLIDRALALLQARDAGPQLARVDLAALCQTIVDDMEDAGVAVTLGALAPVNATCDPGMLTSAIENLLQNAANHGGGGTLSLRGEGSVAVIEVADSGPGLSAQDRAHAFEPWYRGDTARAGNGNGLGLAIVHAIMTSLGGRIELSDASPSGLIARLILPLKE